MKGSAVRDRFPLMIDAELRKRSASKTQTIMYACIQLSLLQTTKGRRGGRKSARSLATFRASFHVASLRNTWRKTRVPVTGEKMGE